MIQISIVNHAATPLGVHLDALVSALQKYVDQYFVPAWGEQYAAKLVRADSVPALGWCLAFFDDADQPGALGYHERTWLDEPLGKVFVRTTIADGELVSVTAAHELVEMLADPKANLTAQDPATGVVYAYEPCDAVEEDTFLIDGIAASNFVLPCYFAPSTADTKWDYLGKLPGPFAMDAGGYSAVIGPDGQWTQIFGSREKAERFAREDRRGHRNEGRPPMGSPFRLLCVQHPKATR